MGFGRNWPGLCQLNLGQKISSVESGLLLACFSDGKETGLLVCGSFDGFWRVLLSL